MNASLFVVDNNVTDLNQEFKCVLKIRFSIIISFFIKITIFTEGYSLLWPCGSSCSDYTIGRTEWGSSDRTFYSSRSFFKLLVSFVAGNQLKQSGLLLCWRSAEHLRRQHSRKKRVIATPLPANEMPQKITLTLHGETLLDGEIFATHPKIASRRCWMTRASTRQWNLLMKRSLSQKHK